MTIKIAFWKWFLIGGFSALLLILGQASSVGGFEGLLQVGERSELRPRIEAELGQVPLAANTGHDGQIYYAIGLDLLGQEVPEELDHGAYRYRRILFPVIASVFGLLEGEALLVGMIGTVTAATAVAAGITAATAVSFQRSDWFAVAVLANPGVWLSVRLLTADVVALALMLLGLFWIVTGRRGASFVFALSGLAKDVFLTTPGGLALSRDRRRWHVILLPAVVLVLWMAMLSATMGEGFTGRGNLAVPFAGIVEASEVWPAFSLSDLLYVSFGLVSVAGGIVYAVLVRSWLRWSIFGWALLGIISSNWVWDLGNNAARAFAPIAVLVALSVAASNQGQTTGTVPDPFAASESQS